MGMERVCVFFQAEDGIRGLVRSRGVGDVYKRQEDNKGRLKRAIDAGVEAYKEEKSA